METYSRFAELESAIKNGKFERFLETIETIKEMDDVQEIIKKNFPEVSIEIFDAHRELVLKYSNKRLEDEFEFKNYSLTHEAFKKPGGTIALLLFNDTVKGISIEYELFPLIEHILKEYNSGVKEVHVTTSEFDEFACKLLTYLQGYQCLRLRVFSFPTVWRRGGGSDGQYYWYFK